MSSATRIGIGNLAGVALAISMGDMELYFGCGLLRLSGLLQVS